MPAQALLQALAEGRVSLEVGLELATEPDASRFGLDAEAEARELDAGSTEEGDEAGLKGYDVSGWYGLLAPGKTPTVLVNRINQELQQVLKDPEVLKRFFQAGIEPAPTTPAQFSALIKAEIPKWAKVLKAAGVEPE